MKKIKKDILFKIIAICLSSCLLLDNLAYSAPNLRANLMFGETQRQEGIKRTKDALSGIDNAERAKKSMWYSGLGPEQKEAVSKIIDIYNNSCGLGISEEEKQKIIDDKIIIGDPYIAPFTMFLTFIACFNMVVFCYNLIKDIKPLIIITAFSTMISMIPLLGRLSSSRNEYSRITDKIILKKISFENNDIDSDNLQAISHELTHLLNLPNHRLLAEAYVVLISYKFRLPYETHVLEYKKETDENAEVIDADFLLADVALKEIPDPVKREVTIRKILSKRSLYKKFKKCAYRYEVTKLVKEVYLSLKEKDYSIPRIRSERLNGYVYRYGTVMGYAAVKSYPNIADGFRYIYRLGQARDSRELSGFEPSAHSGFSRAVAFKTGVSAMIAASNMSGRSL